MVRLKKQIIIISLFIASIIGVLLAFFTLKALGFIHKGIELEITVSDKVCYYSGGLIYADNYEITKGALSDGDILSVEYLNPAINVGDYYTSLNAKVMHEETDVTDNYHIVVRNGKLKIEKRNITVECMYDVYPSEDMFNSLALRLRTGYISPNEHLVPYEKNRYQRGDSQYDIGAYVYDSTGNNVSSNYEITVINPEILKPEIVITTPSQSFVYDGTEHSATNYSIIGLSKGDYLDIDNITPTKVVNVNKNGYQNILKESEVIIRDRTGIDVTGYYNITIENLGLLMVLPLDVNVSTSSSSFTYDGTYHSGNYTSDNLLFNELVPSGVMSQFKDVGSYNNIVSFDYDLITNFNIHYNFGTINIQKKKVSVYLPNLKGNLNATRDNLLAIYNTKDIDTSIDNIDIKNNCEVLIENISYDKKGTYNYYIRINDDLLNNYDFDIQAGKIIIE